VLRRWSCPARSCPRCTIYVYIYIYIICIIIIYSIYFIYIYRFKITGRFLTLSGCCGQMASGQKKLTCAGAWSILLKNPWRDLLRPPVSLEGSKVGRLPKSTVKDLDLAMPSGFGKEEFREVWIVYQATNWQRLWCSQLSQLLKSILFASH
jgi:hypothetical protein